MKILPKGSKLKDLSLFEEIAEELNIETKDVENIISSLIDWTHKNMSNLKVPCIRWPKFITFEMRPHKLKDPEVKELYRKYIEKDYGNYPRRYLNERGLQLFRPPKPIKKIRTRPGKTKSS
jgi:hypothetical protein